MSVPIGFMVVEPSPIPSEPPKADWDGEIHPTREQAAAECVSANSSGSEPYEAPDDRWRVDAVVEVDAIAEAEKRGAVKALRAAADDPDADEVHDLNGYARDYLRRHAAEIDSGEETP